MMTTIDEMKKLCDEATDGPWVRITSDERKNIVINMVEEIVPEYSQEKTIVTISATAWKPERFANAGTNADFISASRTFVPEAIRVLEQMAEALRVSKTSMLDSGYQLDCVTIKNVSSAIAAFDALGVE